MRKPTRLPVAMLVLASCAEALTSRSSRSRLHTPPGLLRLRGGADDAIKDEIVGRLNQCPAFCLLSREKKLVGIDNGEGGHDVAWFIDAAEAQEVLQAATAASPDEGYHLGCTPLGDALLMCNGWPGTEVEYPEYTQEVSYRLRGPREPADEHAPVLEEQLQSQGLASGGWVVPLFCVDEFQTDQMMPFFFTKADLADGWARTGRPDDELPEAPVTMELRLLIAAMRSDASLRRKARVVPSVEAYELSQRIAAAREESE